MNKKIPFVFTLLIVASMLLSACGGAEQPPATQTDQTEAPAAPATTEAPATEAAAPAPEPFTLTVWYWGEQEAPGMKDFMENAVQIYMQENPHITVNAVLQESDSLYPAFRAAAEAKEGPDIQFFWGGVFTLAGAMLALFPGGLGFAGFAPSPWVWRASDEPDTIWHVGSRVNWRAWHLVSEEAFRAFVDCFRRAIERFGMDLLEFVLMSNHYHAVLRSPPAALYRQLTSRKTTCSHLRPYPPWHSKSTVVGQCLRQVKLDVANRIQRSLGLDGHFWDGKHFRKKVVDADTLVVVMAYDHRNPVREAMVARPEDYPRSSAAWWLRGDPVALPLCQRLDFPFGLSFESLRAELLRFQQDRRLDDVMEALAKTNLEVGSRRLSPQAPTRSTKCASSTRATWYRR